MTHDRILIVGAGLAGLALARALGHVGLAAELVEREAGWQDAGTGMYLPANGVRALRALGLEAAVAAGRHPSGSCASRRVTLSRGAASHPQRRHHRANSSVSTTRQANTARLGSIR